MPINLQQRPSRIKRTAFLNGKTEADIPTRTPTSSPTCTPTQTSFPAVCPGGVVLVEVCVIEDYDDTYPMSLSLDINGTLVKQFSAVSSLQGTNLFVGSLDESLFIGAPNLYCQGQNNNVFRFSDSILNAVGSNTITLTNNHSGGCRCTFRVRVSLYSKSNNVLLFYNQIIDSVFEGSYNNEPMWSYFYLQCPDFFPTPTPTSTNIQPKHTPTLPVSTETAGPVTPTPTSTSTSTIIPTDPTPTPSNSSTPTPTPSITPSNSRPPAPTPTKTPTVTPSQTNKPTSVTLVKGVNHAGHGISMVGFNNGDSVTFIPVFPVTMPFPVMFYFYLNNVLIGALTVFSQFVTQPVTLTLVISGVTYTVISNTGVPQTGPTGYRFDLSTTPAQSYEYVNQNFLTNF